MEAACSVQFSPPVTIDDLQTSQFLTQSLSKQSHHSIASVGKNVMLDLLPCRTTCEPAQLRSGTITLKFQIQTSWFYTFSRRFECLVNVLLNRHIRSEVLYHLIETDLLL